MELEKLYKFGKLVKVLGRPVVYQWEIDGKVLEFIGERALVTQMPFIRMSLKELNKVPPTITRSDWQSLVVKAKDTMDTIDRKSIKQRNDSDVFVDHLLSFIDKLSNPDPVFILMGQIFKDEKSKLYYFKGSTFSDYLFEDCNFKKFSHDKISFHLMTLKAKRERLTVYNVMTQERCWSMPFSSIEALKRNRNNV